MEMTMTTIRWEIIPNDQEREYEAGNGRWYKTNARLWDVLRDGESVTQEKTLRGAKDYADATAHTALRWKREERGHYTAQQLPAEHVAEAVAALTTPPTMDDDRLQSLIDHLATAGDGFANNVVWKPELLAALRELAQRRKAAARGAR